MSKQASLFTDLIKKLDLGDNAVIVPLAGDASTREYYRIVYPSGTLILMSQEPFDPEQESFVRFQNLYKMMNMPVPTIHSLYPEQGFMVLEDLGDKHLQNINGFNLQFRKYYFEAIDILCKMQLQHNDVDIKFNHSKFYNELNMTTDYYLAGLKKKEISSAIKNDLNSFYNSLVDKMMKQPMLLLHRDYHSRNLLIHKEKIHLIDFQDSRMGPYTYDLASIIIDPYASLDEKLSDELVKHYYSKIKDDIKTDYYEFLYNYNLCYLQRGIKILGTFAYQHVKNYNDIYLQYIPTTIEKIKSVLGSFPEWQSLIQEVIIA